jgi:sugar lactone lactonase YvrE
MALPAAAAQSGATKPVSATVVAEYEQGEFLESVAFDRHGNMYVTSAFKGVIYKLAPDGTQTTFATFPVGEGDFGQQSGAVLTLVLDRGGIVYATVQHPDPTLHGVWRIAPDGTKAVVATLPLDAQPNGITIDRRGNLLSPIRHWALSGGLSAELVKLRSGSRTICCDLQDQLAFPVRMV